MKISPVGVDLAKNVFQAHGVDIHGKAAWKPKLSRERWIEAVCKTAPQGCEIGMEACGSAHHWARRLTELGYEVKLISPHTAVRLTEPIERESWPDLNNGLLCHC